LRRCVLPLALVSLLLLAGAVGVAGARSARAVGTLDNAEPAGGPRFAVGEIVVTYTDPTRRVSYPGQSPVARSLTTVIRYPALGDPSRVDVAGAAPARGPFPLIVFSHGFDITPGPYARLLQAWARAGYVVAAPTFPRTNARAPGGPDEDDLVNQPADVSFVISRMLAGSGRSQGILSGLIAPGAVGVSGQSDGGSTALATAYNRRFVDRRIHAAVILSGAEIPGLRGYTFPAPSPPLLAVQGTGDTVNLPVSTDHFFRRAPQPKFLLSLFGAPHLGPYTNEQPQLGIVERETVAFLDRYLKDRLGAWSRMWQVGEIPRVAGLSG
jgi:dienelactone hydrolase